MVHGCPVVSSNATCLPEVYGDAAVYFEPENPEEMATQILKVVRGPKTRENLIQKGYAQAKNYSWKRMAEQTLEVYQSLLN
jgi:glycosyltransferase involved in cell wall biosynthesis